MEITIDISNTPQGIDTKSCFNYLWLRYVRGFKPWKHCLESLVGDNDTYFDRNMLLPAKYVLNPQRPYNHIYLCGELKNEPGLHLAMLPQEGAVIEYKMQNGMVIRVSNARQLPITKLPEGYMGMPWDFVSCCNWQFGIQYYGTGGWEPKPVQ